MAGGDPPEHKRRRRVNRERVVRTLTFWLRPEFVLRVVNRFQKVAGFDRAVALASAALTALIPLAIVASSVAKELGGKGTADRIIDRYELTGGGAEAVRDIFAPPTGTSTTLGIVGAGLGAIGALLSVGGANPWWSLAVFALCVYILHGILVLGQDERALAG